MPVARQPAMGYHCLRKHPGGLDEEMAQNTTNRNRTKRARLDAEHVIPSQNVRNPETTRFLEKLLELDAAREDIIYSLGLAIVGANDNPEYIGFTSGLDCSAVELPALPSVIEFDLLGSACQYLNSKSENLSTGSFYTGYDVARDFVADLDFSAGQDIFDPACGSGAFLFASDAPPEHLHGVDADPVAVMAAKFNYFAKFSEAPAPDIACRDFFSWLEENPGASYDYVVGNPPYGADMELPEKRRKESCVSSGESFSYFVEAAYPLATKTFRFLIPEALLNVKRHTDIRTHILEETDLVRIRDYSKRFSGVMSDTYMIEMKPLSDSDGKSDAAGWRGQPNVRFESASTADVPKRIYAENAKKLFLHLDEDDISIIEKIDKRGRYFLPAEAFALGIVTGGNKDKLFPDEREGSEPIYTGKEITGRRYTFLSAKNRIVYARDGLQQVAPDCYYRAPVKLVYKAINKYLKFVVDESGSLTTNSANIILPMLDGLSPYVMLAFLNSRPFSFYHLKMFGGVNKVAKENMMAMPFPDIPEEQQRKIEELVRGIITAGGGADDGQDAELLDYVESDVYGFSEEERKHLRECLSF